MGQSKVFTSSFISAAPGIPLSPLPGGSNFKTSEREKNLQDQIRQMKKMMQHKEQEFSKDKALWIQKYELSDRELIDTRSRMENQKKYYLGLIDSLKQMNCSPIKEQSFERTPKNEDNICSKSQYEEKIEEAVKNFRLVTTEHEKSVLERNQELKQWQQKEKEMQNQIASLEDKLKEYEQQIELSEQHQLEFTHKDA